MPAHDITLFWRIHKLEFFFHFLQLDKYLGILFWHQYILQREVVPSKKEGLKIREEMLDFFN
jgi:hypothetical protein